MGYCVNTTYVNVGNVVDVARALIGLCRAEGMEEIPCPMRRERLTVEPMQYDSALHNDLWGLAIFPGAPSWTVIQTAPLELLAERAPDAVRMRLADLCIQLSAPAFQLNVYDGTGTILAEVSNTGEVAVSGLNAQSEHPFDWHGQRLSEELFEARFILHPFQHLIADAPSGDEKAEAIARHFGHRNAAFCDNTVSVDTLISHRPFAALGGQTLYFKWPGPSRQRHSACASWVEYRAAIDRK